MKNKIVPIKNVAKLAAAGEALIQRAMSMPGMGLIWGRTGFGKTTAATWLVNQVNGVYVRALATSTPASLLGSISREIDLPIKGSCANMTEAIVDRLGQSGRSLFVDEADHIADSKRMTEIMRDLHDLATVPVILIGMGSIKHKLAKREQLYGRISQWVEFQPADLDDTEMLAEQLCEVEVEHDLLVELHKASEGSVRLLVVGLAQIEYFARSRGLKRVDASKWSGDFHLDSTPVSRRRGRLVAIGGAR